MRPRGDLPTILITGFGPFPGAPTNPTMRLARHIGGVRRVAFAGLRREVRLLPTTWAMLDGVPALVRDVRPDAVLMFGLAGRRRRITPEARALNRASPLRVDAEGAPPPAQAMARGAGFARNGSISAGRMAAALRREGLPAAVSRDAGDYLCNGLFWRMLETGVPCIFVHVPRPVRPTLPRGRMKRPRPTARGLQKAAEIALACVARSVAGRM
jgi:pyroglutamyl-peptidase